MEIELCIKCTVPTTYKKSDHIDTRVGYIEGSGQLCIDCLQKLEEKKIDPDAVSWGIVG
jgi:hypothetical protein